MAYEILRLAAFTDDPAGGNPAGVVIADQHPDPSEMQRIAAELGYSETAFLAPADGERAYAVRYFSPAAEVPFCGHATVASGVALGERFGAGSFRFATPSGLVPVEVKGPPGAATATLTSVMPQVRRAPGRLTDSALRALAWSSSALDPSMPPAVAYAGNWHLVLPVVDRATLAGLDYDFDGLRRAMLEHDLTTVHLVWREDATTYWARDPFPVGGVVEDPATGAAAAAFGAYLRHHDLVPPPVDVTIHQGDDMGRPSLLLVTIPVHGGILVTGRAVAIPDA